MNRRWSVVAACALAAALAAPAAHALDAAQLASQGNGKGAPPCLDCHGIDGGGQVADGFPRLAALDAVYLRRQLDSFADGSRDDPVMKPIATALSSEERQALAEYYSQLPLPAALARPATPSPAPDSRGALLATRGRWSRQVPACEQCHGPGGVGVGAAFPPLAGQPAAYLAAQLKAWQQGRRHNDPLALMQHISTALDEEDVNAVAAWFAAQPLDHAETTP
ncbi:c-type cytochrome [Dyella sp. KRB-257]|uniref:c-type cytochrome n=1 Tax=Dyella sp. KRB-257 TaxID=3400915 RepID=UPI003C04FF63